MFREVTNVQWCTLSLTHLKRLSKEFDSFAHCPKLGVVVGSEEGHDDDLNVRVLRVLHHFEDGTAAVAGVVGEGRRR